MKPYDESDPDLTQHREEQARAAFPLGRRTEAPNDDPEDQLTPPGYFVASASHAAICAHCGGHVFDHVRSPASPTRLQCPKGPIELREGMAP